MRVSVSAPHRRRVWPPTSDRRGGQAAGGDVDRQLDLGHRPELQAAAALEGDGGQHRAEGDGRQRLGRHPRQRQRVPRTRGGSAEAACEDTTPEPPAAGAEGGGGEQADERDQRGGHVAAGARQLRRGPGPRAARAGRRRRPAWSDLADRGRAPCAARAWRWPAGRRSPRARRSARPRSRGRWSPSRPRSRRRRRWPAAAAAVGAVGACRRRGRPGARAGAPRGSPCTRRSRSAAGRAPSCTRAWV